MIKNMLSAAVLVASLFALVSLPAAAQVYVQIAPPAPMVETIPAGRSGYVWVGGYWKWNGSKYVWVSGHYDHPGAGYKHWCSGHWHHGAHGYWWVDGHWCA